MKRLEVLSVCENEQNYGAGWGVEQTITYKCPCGKGEVVEDNDQVPGFRSHDIINYCENCKDNWVVEPGGRATKKGE